MWEADIKSPEWGNRVRTSNINLMTCGNNCGSEVSTGPWFAIKYNILCIYMVIGQSPAKWLEHSLQFAFHETIRQMLCFGTWNNFWAEAPSLTRNDMIMMRLCPLPIGTLWVQMPTNDENVWPHKQWNKYKCNWHCVTDISMIDWREGMALTYTLCDACSRKW